VSDPEETAPLTHQPYGGDGGGSPFVSPSGPGHSIPPPPPPPPVPYGSPAPPPYGYQPGYGPAYAGAYPGSISHQGGTTALTLGIISIASLVLTPFCCVTIVGVFCAPFAWGIGARAKREIEQQPGVYGNLGNAQTGMWMGIVMTILGALTILGLIALVVWIGYSGPILV
jgi:hypothetical protein